MKNEESKIQQACVRWFRLSYPKLASMLFAVPNGGQRNAITAKILKAEGVVSGVSDLILLTPRHGYGALCIEMKQEKGKQSQLQKLWEQESTKAGNRYVVCHSLDEFINEIKSYLNG